MNDRTSIGDHRVLVGTFPAAEPGELSVQFGGSRQTFKLAYERIAVRLAAPVPDRLLDFLEIASGIYASDGWVKRGGATRKNFGSGWQRRFNFKIAVRDVAFWEREDVSRLLSDLVFFLSEDRANFNFIEAPSAPAQQQYLTLDPGAAFQADEVILFSGGLDSLAGAIEVLTKSDKRIVLVTHRSAQKVYARQEHLTGELIKRFPGRVFWVPVRATLAQVAAKDTLQRCRSLLFLALAFVVARMFGTPTLRFFENGIISVNLPFSEQIVGAMATRTTHPRTIQLMRDLINVIAGEEMDLDNPFFWHTKAEIVHSLLGNGHSDLIKASVSCARVHHATKEQPHCGCCSQCVDRRLAILACNAEQLDPTDGYRIEVVTGARPDNDQRILPFDYVRHAHRLAKMDTTEFVTGFGSDLTTCLDAFPGRTRDEVATDLFNLHHRHGSAVQKVITAAIRHHAEVLTGSGLPDTALLRLIAGPRPKKDYIPVPARKTNAVASTRDDFDIAPLVAGTSLELTMDAQRRRYVVQGLDDLSIRETDLVKCLRDYFDQDLAEQKEGRAFRYKPTKKVADELHSDNESVRKLASRCRERLAQAFEVVTGKAPPTDLLIQSRQRHGYRLDPGTRFVKPASADGTISMAPRHVNRVTHRV